MRVMNKAQAENCTFKSHLGLNIPMKLNETLVGGMMFFRLLGPSKASYSEITFGRKKFRYIKYVSDGPRRRKNIIPP